MSRFYNILKWIFTVIFITVYIFVSTDVKAQKYEYNIFPEHYLNSGNITYYSYIPWNYETVIKYNDTYNTDGYLTERIKLRRIYEFEYINYTRKVITYHNGELINNESSYIWDERINDWLITEENNFNYNNNLVTSFKYNKRIGEDDTLMFINYKTYKYDVYDTLRQIILLQRDTITLKWDTVSIKEYSYNRSENTTFCTEKSWDKNKKIWNNTVKKEEIYNISGYIEQIVFYNWNTDDKTWKKSEKETFRYNDLDWVDTIEYASYIDYLMNWNINEIVIFDYNGDQLSLINYSYMDLILQEYISYKMIHYNYDGIDWYSTEYYRDKGHNSNDKFIYTIEEPHSSVLINNLNEDNIFGIHPNPVVNVLYVSGITDLYNFKCKITTPEGRTVMNKYLESDMIDVSGLATGIYIINIYDNTGKKNVKQFVKTH